MGFLKLSVIAPNATYALSSSAITAEEAAQIVVTLNTTGVQNGQNIPYVISGDGITTSDFTGLSSLMGNFTIFNNAATMVLQTVQDYLHESTETINIKLTDNTTNIDIDLTNAIPGVLWDSGLVWDAGAVYWAS